MEYALINELAGMFRKLADRLNAAAKRPFEYAVIPIVRAFDHNPLSGFKPGRDPVSTHNPLTKLGLFRLQSNYIIIFAQPRVEAW